MLVDAHSHTYYYGRMKTKTLQEMVIELLNSGLTQYVLADLAKTNQPQIARIKKGQKSDYELGKRIEAVYLARVKRTAA